MTGGGRPARPGWLTLRQAAALTGVSVDTMKRRVLAGSFRRATQEAGPRRTWLIPVADLVEAGHDITAADVDACLAGDSAGPGTSGAAPGSARRDAPNPSRQPAAAAGPHPRAVSTGDAAEAVGLADAACDDARSGAALAAALAQVAALERLTATQAHHADVLTQIINRLLPATPPE